MDRKTEIQRRTDPHAATLELRNVPDTQTINAVIAKYREWVLQLDQGELDEGFAKAAHRAGQNQIRRLSKAI